MNGVEGQVSLFGQDTYAGKTCRAASARGTPRGRISASSSKRSAALKAIPYMSLDLTPGHGDLLGRSYWELNSPWRGGCLTLNTGPAPRSADGVCSLSQILQDSPPRKYYLSRKACLGILRRAEARGKPLPEKLKLALEIQAGLRPRLTEPMPDPPLAFHMNQRDEAIDLHDVAGALMRTQNMQMQTFVAAFNAGAGPGAGTIGYQEEVAPTLKAAQSGNMTPSVLCLNDQGGGVMGCSEDVSGTLRAQEHGHQPIVLSSQQGGAAIGEGICPTITAAAGMSGNNQPVLFENHGKDARYRGPLSIAPTVVRTYGTGGNNLPLVSTAVFSRQRVDVFRENEVVCTESARQHKDTTDLVLQADPGPAALLIRRLTPTECELLQGLC